MLHTEEWGDTCFSSFSFPSLTSFRGNFVWLVYLLNNVYSLHTLWWLGWTRVGRPLARLPAHLQLKDAVTLDTSKNFSRTVFSRGCLPSGEPLTCLLSTGNRQGGGKKKGRKAIKCGQQNAHIRDCLEKQTDPYLILEQQQCPEGSQKPSGASKR